MQDGRAGRSEGFSVIPRFLEPHSGLIHWASRWRNLWAGYRLFRLQAANIHSSPEQSPSQVSVQRWQATARLFDSENEHAGTAESHGRRSIVALFRGVCLHLTSAPHREPYGLALNRGDNIP